MRTATCCCGEGFVEVEGDPTLNGVCHCDNCKRRTGSAFGWSVYFRDSQVVATHGEFLEHKIRDEQVRSFCARCGTTLFWKSAFMPGQTGVAGGAFLDPLLPEPSLTATTHKCVAWVALPPHWQRLP